LDASLGKSRKEKFSEKILASQKQGGSEGGISIVINYKELPIFSNCIDLESFH
jgi:hypothetical protein